MGKKLAIRGHSTRGKEVIELLEMMGGKNIHNLYGNNSFEYYVSGHAILNDRLSIIEDDDFVIFNLEEFLEKYPFKVGDKVYTKSNAEGTIIDIFWDGIEVLYQLSSANVNALGYFHRNELKSYKEEVNMEDKEDKLFDSIIWHLRNSVNNGKQNLSGGECEDYFREVVKKNNENKMKNVLAELLEHIKTTPKEDLEREFEEIAEWANVGPTVEEFMTFCECVNKKPTYPKLKNLTECREILGEKDMYQSVSGYKGELLTNFQRLLIFRDAYWKIAGEEMGLGKPWEPDWNHWDHINRKFYCIYNSKNNIVKNVIYSENKIIAFPTEEMRDVFYDNFKDLIESCKELL